MPVKTRMLERSASFCALQSFKGEDVTRRDGSRFFLSQRLLMAAPAVTGPSDADGTMISPAQRAVVRDPELRQWLKQLIMNLQKGESAAERLATQERMTGRERLGSVAIDS